MLALKFWRKGCGIRPGTIAQHWASGGTGDPGDATTVIQHTRPTMLCGPVFLKLGTAGWAT